MKREQVLDLRASGALVCDARRDFLDRERAVEHETDRIVDVAALGRVEAGALQAHAVDGARRRPVPFGDRERHDVLVRERARGHERVRAEPRELRDAGEAADERVVLDRHVARELRAVDDDDVIGELAVMADVRVGHDEVVIADARDAAALRGTDVDADELADPIVRADRERRVRAAVVAQVLRRPAEHGAVLDAVVGADRHAPVATADPRVRLDDGTGADIDLALDDAVRADLRIGGDRGALAQDDARVNAQGES